MASWIVKPAIPHVPLVYSRWIDIRFKNPLLLFRRSPHPPDGRRWKLNPAPPKKQSRKNPHIQRMSIAVKIVKCEVTIYAESFVKKIE